MDETKIMLRIVKVILKRYWVYLENAMLYSRHGQTAARGPHAALQSFFVAPLRKYFPDVMHLQIQ
jgi:hypothetical protein